MSIFYFCFGILLPRLSTIVKRGGALRMSWTQILCRWLLECNCIYLLSFFFSSLVLLLTFWLCFLFSILIYSRWNLYAAGNYFFIFSFWKLFLEIAVEMFILRGKFISCPFMVQREADIASFAWSRLCYVLVYIFIYFSSFCRGLEERKISIIMFIFAFQWLFFLLLVSFLCM